MGLVSVLLIIRFKKKFFLMFIFERGGRRGREGERSTGREKRDTELEAGSRL